MAQLVAHAPYVHDFSLTARDPCLVRPKRSRGGRPLVAGSPRCEPGPRLAPTTNSPGPAISDLATRRPLPSSGCTQLGPFSLHGLLPTEEASRAVEEALL